MKKEDLRILKTKASLYRALIELMKEKEFEQIKISEICAKSMINRSTFYDHYNDKYELLVAFMNDMKKELETIIVVDKEINNIKEYYIEILKVLLDHIDENKEIYSSLSKINSNSIAKDMMIDTVLNSVIKRIEEGFINKSNIPTKTAVLFYASGIINIIEDSLQDVKKFDKEKILSIISVLLPTPSYIVPIKK